MMPLWEGLIYPVWATGTVYDLGDIVIPSSATGYAYEITDLGIEGGLSGSEPSWPTVLGRTVLDDNGVEYMCWRSYPWGEMKYNDEVWEIPVPYELPKPHYGFFEINGPLTGARRHHMTANKLSLGDTRDKLLADELWTGGGGRYPSDDSIGIQGKVRQYEVYGFYVLWGLRWIDLLIPYIPFGFAKCFPIQPSVQLEHVSPIVNLESIGPSFEVSVIETPGG